MSDYGLWTAFFYLGTETTCTMYSSYNRTVRIKPYYSTPAHGCRSDTTVSPDLIACSISIPI